MVRLKDVAQEARVTATTVSRILNNRGSPLPVSEETRQRVLRAAKQLNYQPDYTARSLRTRRTFTIGVVTPSPRDQWRMLDTAEQIVETRGFELVMTISRWNAGTEEKALRRLLSRRVDGILILGSAIESGNRQALESLAAKQYPVVGIGPMVVRGIDSVDFDRTAALHTLTAHLRAQGCRSFVFLENADTPGCRALIAGIEAALKGCPGVSFTPLRFTPINQRCSLSHVAEGLAMFLKTNRPDAIICRTDELALTVIGTARRLGLAVPEQMAVTGSGNIPLGAELPPALTTLEIPQATMVQAAMTRIFDQILRPAVPYEPLAKLVPAELIVRQSSRFGSTPPADRIRDNVKDGTAP